MDETLWREHFEQAKAGKYEWLQLVYDSDTPQQLLAVKDELDKKLPLLNSSDPIQHWDGYLAQVNLKICEQKLVSLLPKL